MSSPGYVIPQARDSNNITQLQFPSNMPYHHMIITFSSYSYDDARRGFQGVSISADNPKSSISLPLPATIVDKYGLGVADWDLGMSGQGAAEAASSAGGGVAGLKAALGDNWEAIMGLKLSDTGDLLTTAAKTMGRNTALVRGSGIGSGAALNPYKALEFKGVDMKDFTFNWIFRPETESESDAVKSIIDTIRYHSLPDYSFGVNNSTLARSALKYPDLAFIEFKNLNKDYWFRFKPCMVASINVDYTTAGQTILVGGKPAVINLSLSFKESDIHTRKDYPKGQS